ncbi:hypothetical protein CAPSP0001_0360 [Capnocytophaga sputigena ATCC 33612]|nr:hypothetical protein CAPSP0001_0360 [Capnocytophaga sputigena ATCC 33612]
MVVLLGFNQIDDDILHNLTITCISQPISNSRLPKIIF